MDRAAVRAVLGREQDTARVVSPLLMEHACSLEQLPVGASRGDVEALSRALRNARRRYSLDLVLVEFDVARITEGATAGVLPTIEEVLGQGALQVALHAFERLRSTFGTRTALGVAMPSAAQLASALGSPAARDWSAATLLGILRQLGPHEPDLVLLCGSDAGDEPRLRQLCEFFDVTLLTAASSGVCAPSGAAFLADAGCGACRLVVTRDPLPANADPRQVAAAIERARSGA